MRFFKKSLLFFLGGGGYVGLELLWRGRSHGSMFLAGGSCFLLLGRLSRKKLPLPVKGAAGAGIITGVELLTGLLCNRDHRVWDYRQPPFNYRGQICLLYTLLWVPVSLGGMALYRVIEGSGRKILRRYPCCEPDSLPGEEKECS